MKVAVISDIHSNLHALLEVARDIEKENVEQVWCLGDVIGYGAFPNECVQWVRDNVSLCVSGNHELFILTFPDLSFLSKTVKESLEWTRQTLTEENLSYLSTLPPQILKEEVQLVHDTPEAPGSVQYIETEDDAYRALLKQKGDICFFGHTHVPVAFCFDIPHVKTLRLWTFKLRSLKYLINPGSVGQPRNKDPRASYIILEDRTVRFKKVEYPVKKAARAILDVGLPEFFAARLLLGV